MACMGPSKEFAIIKSQEAHDKIIQMIKDQYHVERPEAALGIGIERRWQDEWDKEESALRTALADLFWTSDCASF